MGDARSTIAELTRCDPRAAVLGAVYSRRFAARRHDVLAAGAELKLVEAGNHAQGIALTKLAPIWHAWRHYAKLAEGYPAAD